ncbi:MAG: hypothetical protein A2Z42_04665 [Candidatus Woykebacteria bacterium RBG_19FT_COMBO_43_10]|uniref:Uncharacterized protein n=1 Tax=Candidatus Woykebacteria bacterium RBG_19FT_COMBO_43_10 TaxID=1802598 RepID=A0A1G1WFD0_9BACT|nr:MAG: hypothetical protein A2Z42_04665 [Candidatus Woykebacteria bacterium RBG_19FT_COMBO_43_10]
MQTATQVVIFAGVVTLVGILGIGWLGQQASVRAIVARIGEALSRLMRVIGSIISWLVGWLKIALACTVPLLMALIIMRGEFFDPKNFLLWIAVIVWALVVFVRRETLRS